MPLLEVSGVRVSYGPVRAVDDVNLDVDPGEVVALVGSNGAGKSTMLKAIIGYELSIEALRETPLFKSERAG